MEKINIVVKNERNGYSVITKGFQPMLRVEAVPTLSDAVVIINKVADMIAVKGELNEDVVYTCADNKGKISLAFQVKRRGFRYVIKPVLAKMVEAEDGQMWVGTYSKPDGLLRYWLAAELVWNAHSVDAKYTEDQKFIYKDGNPKNCSIENLELVPAGDEKPQKSSSKR